MAVIKDWQTISELDFTIDHADGPVLESPLKHVSYVADEEGVAYYSRRSTVSEIREEGKEIPYFEAAGPRRHIRHDPAWTRAAIVTCGGLCPGLNDVVKGLVNTLWLGYGVTNIFGIRYGYRGLVSSSGLDPIDLNPEIVDTIHENGGSILGTSRGQQDTEEIVRTLHRRNINVLFAIGGDGTLRAAREISECAQKWDLPISVIGVPKTIDNDVGFMERTFGFETAVYAASPVISCAHDEAKAVQNGIGLVRLMGRDSGFLAAYACLANSVANMCLIPEVPFEMAGDHGLLAAVRNRLTIKDHMVIVVAEGAGQDLMEGKEIRDASGNLLNKDIGIFLKNSIGEDLDKHGMEYSIKYFDPSYLVRSVPARGTDAVFCVHLAENAVHAAMSGRTNMVVGHWQGQFTHVPIALATRERRRIDPTGQIWQSVQAVTRQERYWSGDE